MYMSIFQVHNISYGWLANKLLVRQSGQIHKSLYKLLMESIRSPDTLSGLHQEVWGSVTY